MDPYLEQHWPDVHGSLIGYIRDALQPQLSGDLIARMEESIFIEDDDELHIRRPDVRVVEEPSWSPGGATATAAAVADQPLLLRFLRDPIRQRSVVITDSEGRRIITAIEVLSYTNKDPRRGLKDYLLKREKYNSSNTNLVEIDLLRAGDWQRMIGNVSVPREARTTYRVTVERVDEMGVFHYPVRLQSKLPTIQVPLRPSDPPATLNLQQLIEKVYEMGRYDRINYSKPCQPELDGEDAAWAQSLLADRTQSGR
jgi:hypothetical protein